MPELARYQLRDGPHVGEPTTERGEIERLARTCQASACHAGLDSTVIETRFNVVRSGVPDQVITVRKLRDYLPSVDYGDGTDAGGRDSLTCSFTLALHDLNVSRYRSF